MWNLRLLQTTYEVYQLPTSTRQSFTFKPWVFWSLLSIHALSLSHQKHLIADVVAFWHVSLVLYCEQSSLKWIRWFHMRSSNKRKEKYKTCNCHWMMLWWFLSYMIITFCGQHGASCKTQYTFNFCSISRLHFWIEWN